MPVPYYTQLKITNTHTPTHLLIRLLILSYTHSLTHIFIQSLTLTLIVIFMHVLAS